MSAAGPPDRAPGRPARPRLIVPAYQTREVVFAVAGGLVLLGLIGVGVWTLFAAQGRPSANQLTGVIVAKHDRGEHEQLLSVGRKGLHAEDGESPYSFDVRVEPGGRIYEVPVEQTEFSARKVGEKEVFIRPPSEQR